MRKVLFVANTGWYAFNFLVPIAKCLEEYGMDVSLGAPAGSYLNRCEEEGFVTKAVPISRTYNVKTDIQGGVALRRIIRTECYDFVHVFGLKALWTAVMALSWTRAPRPFLVINFSGTGYVFGRGGPLRSMQRKFVLAVLRFADRRFGAAAVFQNRVDQRIFTEKRLFRSSRLVGGSGVEVGKFYCALRQPPPESLTVLFAGRLLREKGLVDFLDVASRLHEKFPGVRYWVAGTRDPGNPSSHTSFELDRWQQIGYVRFLGHVEDMPQLFAATDILVLPSRYKEGLPRTLLEAGAAGVFCIGYDNPGVTEVLDHGRNGVVVDPPNVLRLTQEIENILGRPDARRRMAAALQADVLSSFSVDSVATGFLSLYAELAGDPPSLRRK